jgi:hypothetical protein
MPKTHATGRARHSEQKRDAQQAASQGHIGGQGMGQGRGMNPGEVQRKRPGVQPGQAEEPHTQTPPDKPGQFEHARVEKPKDRATKSGRLKLPPQEDPV